MNTTLEPWINEFRASSAKSVYMMGRNSLFIKDDFWAIFRTKNGTKCAWLRTPIDGFVQQSVIIVERNLEGQRPRRS
jgi:hypothetical protein